MKQIIIFLTLLMAFNVHADKAMIAINSVVSQEEIQLVPGELYVVPKCKRWVLKNTHKLSHESWYQISGSFKVMSINELPEQTYYIAEGNIKVIPGFVLGPQQLVVDSGNSVVAFTKSEKEAFWVSEQTMYVGPGASCG